MTRTRRALLLASFFAALIAWQLGSIGPIYLQVSSASGESLENLLINVRLSRNTGHMMTGRFSSYKTAKSDTTIRFPRAFVCWCLSKPVMRLTIQHPVALYYEAIIDPNDIRRFSSIKVPTISVQSMSDLLENQPSWFVSSGDDDADERMIENEFKRSFEAHTRALVRHYVEHVDVGMSGEIYIEALRQQMELAGLNIQENPEATKWYRELAQQW